MAVSASSGSCARVERMWATRASRTSKGSDLRMRNLTTSSRSDARPAPSSAAGMSETRATGSGRTSPMGAPPSTPARSIALRRAERKASGSAMFGWVKAGRRTSGAKSTAAAAARITAPFSRRVRTTPTPVGRISTATSGRSGSASARQAPARTEAAERRT